MHVIVSRRVLLLTRLPAALQNGRRSSTTTTVMPAFQSLVKGGQGVKVGSSAADGSKKRKLDVITDDADGSIVVQDHARAGEQFWMVQWFVPLTLFRDVLD